MIKQVIISAHQLGKSFGGKNNQETIFSHLNLEIYQGDFTVIMGASGAGKSTLLYSLSGMDKPTEGEVYIDGTNITQMTSDQLAKFRRKQCGFVFQQIYLMQEQNLMDNVLIAGTLLTRKRKELLAQAK
ncbi:ATP-binding cassette domain-containing protein, partial [Streptococcus sobrinus]